MGVAVLLLACSLIRSWSLALNSVGIDFYHYWVIPRAVFQGETANVYSPEGRKTVAELYLERTTGASDSPSHRMKAAQYWTALEPSGTPFFYFSLAPFSIGDYEHSLIAFQILSMLAGMAALLWLALACGLPTDVALLTTVVCTDWSGPWVADVRVCNVNRLLFAGLTLFLWIRSRDGGPRHDLLGGIVLGLLVLFKPILLFCMVALVVLRLLRRDYSVLTQEALGYLAAGATAIASSAALFGSSRCWWDWANNVNAMLPSNTITVEKGNYAPTRMLSEALQFSSTAYLILFVAIVSLPLVIRAKRGPCVQSVGIRWRTEALFIALGLLVYFGAARLVWLHYHLLSNLPLLLLATAPSRGHGWLVLLGSAFVAVAVNPLIALFQLQQPIVFAAIVCAGGWLLTALVTAEIWRALLDDPAAAPSVSKRTATA